MNITEQNIELFPCQCGCGELAPPGEAFIPGHDEIYAHYRHWAIDYKIKSQLRIKIKPQLCKCGCGEYALPGNRFVKGHIKQIKGGSDLLWHHVAYDFLRPEALRVRITRKFHGQIHNPKGVKFGGRGYSLID